MQRFEITVKRCFYGLYSKLQYRSISAVKIDMKSSMRVQILRKIYQVLTMICHYFHCI